MIVVNYMSKMRTEVYFEGREGQGEWTRIRSHWQFAMGGIVEAFPFLNLNPKRKAVEQKSVEIIDTGDDGETQYVSTGIVFDEEQSEEDWWDDDEMDNECLLEIGNGEYSYGEMFGGEAIVHEIGISLNNIGERWSATLQVLEEAEIVSVDLSPRWISVAPWHSRDV
jgi:hypothetical protein